MTSEEIAKSIQEVTGLSTMTVNERLIASGLSKEFEKSLKHEK